MDNQKTNQRSRIIWPILLGIYVCLFLGLSALDLPTSMYWTQHCSHALVWFGEHISIIPTGLILAYCGMALRKVAKKKQQWWLCLLIAIIGSCIAGYFITQPRANFAGVLLVVIVAFIILTIMKFLADHTNMNTKRAVYVCIAGILLVALSQATTTVLKMIWARPRFISLADPISDFQPWYTFHGLNLTDDLHMSFPSGHTTASATVLWLSFLPYINERWKKYQGLIWVLIVLWVFIAAFSRVMAGMHFISDTMGAFFIVLCIYLLLRYQFVEKNGK